MKMHRICLVVAGLLFISNCLAQSWPGRPLRVIVPYPPGGPTDSIARPITQGLTELLGQSAYMEHRPGANSILGADLVAHSAPDGYTMLLATISAMALNPAGYAKLPYDAMKDFTHISKLASSYHLIVARKGFPANNMAELIAYAKKNPGRVSFGTTGIGSSGHIACLMLESVAGVKLLHVPYKGAAIVLTDLLSENVDIHAGGPAPLIPQVKAGKIKAYASTSEKRLAAYPDVPSMTELGYKGYITGGWYSMSVRAGTPSAIASRLNGEINSILNRPAVKSALEVESFSVDADMNLEQTAKFMQEEFNKWGRLIRQNNISFE